MKLTKTEQETIILWNNAESQAEIYTCDKRIRKVMDNYYEKGYCTLAKSDDYSKTYILPKNFIQVKNSYCKSRISSEKRQSSILRAREFKNAK